MSGYDATTSTDSSPEGSTSESGGSTGEPGGDTGSATSGVESTGTDTSGTGSETTGAPEFCGDASVQADEECDDGQDGDNTDDCTDACLLPACGDMFVQAGEQCDDGQNGDNTDDCTDTCTLPSCGDSFVQTGEECDDGQNADDSDGCLDTCMLAPWGPTMELEVEPGSAVGARVAMDASGNAIALWQQATPPAQSIFARHYNEASQTWGPRIELDNSAVNPASLGRIVMSDSGDADAIWDESSGGVRSLFTRHYDAGTQSWGTAQALENLADNLVHAELAGDAEGNALTVWEVDTAAGFRVYANRRLASVGTWSPPMEVGGTSDFAQYPHADVNAGLGVVGWSRREAVATNAYARRYNLLANGWFPETSLENAATPARAVHVLIDPAGNATTVWRQDSVSSDALYNRYNDNLGEWEGAAFFETEPGDASTPALGADSLGNIHAAWTQEDGNDNMYARRWDAMTQVWGPVELLESENAGNAFEPDITVGDDGSAVVVWRQWDGARYDLMANQYDAASQTWGTARLVEFEEGGYVLEADVAMVDEDHVIVVWSQNDGVHNNIYAAHGI